MKTTILAVAAAIMLVGVFTYVSAADDQQIKPQANQVRWEYKMWDSRDLIFKSLADRVAIHQAVEKQLNEFGADGWEYCDNTDGSIVLKRRRP